MLRGNILVQNHCYRADEMAVMLQIAEEFGFEIRAFHHALEAYKLRDVLAKSGVAVATWADWWGFKLEAWDGIPENAALVSQAGARAVIHSDSAVGIQRLNQEAGKAMWRARDSGVPISERGGAALGDGQPGVGDGRAGARPARSSPGRWRTWWCGAATRSPSHARAQRVYADGVVTYDAQRGPAEPSDFELGERPQRHAHGAARAAPGRRAGRPPRPATPPPARRAPSRWSWRTPPAWCSRTSPC